MLETIILKNFSSRKKYITGSEILLNRGYARYLMKQGYILPNNSRNQEVAQKLLLEEKNKREKKLLHAYNIKQQLEKEKISFIITNCNGNGVLFGAISIKDICRKLNSINMNLYASITPNHLRLKKIIKTYGVYECHVFLYDDVETTFKIYVGNSSENIQKMIGEENKKNPHQNIEEIKKND